ncbi:uncharacterized protein LOC109850955 isoform X2 [Asparagus officinalis]|uniref:uncharacterized protein LOC109850955 isoform X2 n=1 Tax=Asparagus officinalis TaxID=4686 RepID=UPI00098E7FF0|nr:uncharacterized protein LOC109850955 isoform X2 [Asparagus officinalis]
MSLKSKRGFYPLFCRKSLLEILMAILLVSVGAEGAKPSSLTDKVIEQLDNHSRLAVKTIMSEDGDIIDCVDIYKQPAFDHPLLGDHTIEMRPSFIPAIKEGSNSRRFLPQQTWQKKESCPEGTIPIQRIRETYPMRIDQKKFGPNGEFSECKVEMARVDVYNGGPYFGAQATFNVWNLHVEASEWSLNSISTYDPHYSFIEAGWADRTKDVGCFNLRCPGFVHVSKSVMLGAVMPQVSAYGGEQVDYNFVTYKDPVQRKWWILYEGEPVGYWPFALIEGFEESAHISWGGSICDMQVNGFHTTSQMGSGHFPMEGYGKASHIRDILVMDSNKNFVPPCCIQYFSSYEGCYKVDTCKSFPDDKGPCIYYGGTGGKCCDGRYHLTKHVRVLHVMSGYSD